MSIALIATALPVALLSALGPATSAGAAETLTSGPQCATGGKAYGPGEVSIASYNITGHVQSAKFSGWTWTNRRVGVNDFLTRCVSDVYATQENASSWLQPTSSAHYPDTTSQFEQVLSQLNSSLRGRSDATYSLVNSGRENCKRIGKGGYGNTRVEDNNCTYAAESNHPYDNRIMYNTKRLKLVNVTSGAAAKGILDLPRKKLGKGKVGTRRVLHWAQFETIPTDNGVPKRFIVATTHLEAGENSLSYSTRMKQIEKVRAKLSSIYTSTKLPIVLTGDMNATRAILKKTPSDVVRHDKTLKMIDVLGQDYTTYKTRSGKRYRGKCAVPSNMKIKYFVPFTSAARKNAFFDSSSASNLYNDCKTTSWKVNGYTIDFIYTTREWRPQAWETVVNRSSKLARKPAGAAYTNKYRLKKNPNPSDHNMIMTKLLLP